MTFTSPEINLNQELEGAVKRDELSLPLRIREKTLKTFKGHEAEVQRGLLSIVDGQSVFLTGGCGRGKTHLAVGLGYEWFVRGIKYKPIYRDNYEIAEPKKTFPKAPKFKTVIDLMLDLQSSFDSPVTEQEILGRYAGVPLLILDDLGAEKASEWSRSRFYWLLNERYLNCKATIITSNLDLEGISKTIDGRISSRLMEMGEVIKLDGKDYRIG